VRCVRVGGFAERVVLPRENVHVLPDGLDLVAAALAEPASCCLAGLEMVRLGRRATVLVIGGGLMGLLTLAFARARGAGRTILSDPVAERRRAAERLGADAVVDPRTEDLPGVVANLTGGRGVDVACEAVGTAALVRQAIGLVRPRGIVQLVGVSPVGAAVPAELYDLHWRELTIQGAFGRGRSFRRALALLARLDVGWLATARFPLADIAEAFAHAAAGRGVKTVLGPGEVPPPRAVPEANRGGRG
jgi:L-iditol 2-dehydrogenase